MSNSCTPQARRASGTPTRSSISVRQHRLAQAIVLALLGSSPLAMAAPGPCTLSGSGSFSTSCQGLTGSTGGAGGDAATGSGFDLELDNTVTFLGGTGGAGSADSGGVSYGGKGGAGGAGLSGNSFTLTNNASVNGGTGGSGGLASGGGGTVNYGGAGGAGGIGVSGSSFSLTNDASIHGGDGGQGGNANGGDSSTNYAGDGDTGGTGLAGDSFTVVNNGSITGGSGGRGGDASGTASSINYGGDGGNGGAGLTGSSFTLVNNGSITGGARGNSGSGSGSGGSINFPGQANGNDGTGIVSTGGSTIYNSGSISHGGSGNAIELTGTGNRLVLRKGSSITGNVQAGDATVQIGDTGDLYTSTTISGDFTLGTGGVFRVAARSDNSATGYSSLNVTGTVSIDGTAFVNVATANTLADGQTLSGVLTAGTLAGNGNFTEVTDNSALFSFTSRVNGTAIDFDIVRSATINVVSSSRANNNTPALGAARVLDTIISEGSTNTDMQTVVTELGKLATETEVSDAASQTLPLLAGSSQAAAGEATGAVSNVLQGRMGRGLSSGGALLGSGELWLQPFGTWADQDARDGVAGFDVETYGLVLGGDVAASAHARVGAALAYANSQVDSDSAVAPHSADIDLYQLTGYGTHTIDTVTEMTWQLGYGQGHTDGVRRIPFMGRKATSDYISHIAHAAIDLGRAYALSEATRLTPTLRLDYTWIRDESYREKGAGALNLKVEGRTTESLIPGLDGELLHTFNKQLQGLVKVGVGYDVLNEQATVTSAYSGEPGLSFVTRGLEPSPWLGRAGIELEYRLNDTLDLSANYAASFREDFLSQTASLTGRWAF